MPGKFFKYYIYRNFSNAEILRNVEKPKPIEPERSPEDFKGTFKPSEFDKKILVWTGKFKSVHDIPSRIRFHTLENARSRFRIRFGSFLMVATLCMCGFYVWLGKKKARESHFLGKREEETTPQILSKLTNKSSE